MKKIVLTILVALVLFTIPNVTVYAGEGEPAPTYTISADDELIRTNEAYRTNQYKSDLGLSNPVDLYFDMNDDLYIVDQDYEDSDLDLSGRIVIYDIESETISKVLTHESLVSPAGVYVDEELNIYVADPGASAILKFNSDFDLIQTISKPDSIAYDLDNFKPTKVAVDQTGNIFCLVEGGYGGIMQISKDGNFIGYFASNSVVFTNAELVRKFFYDLIGREFIVVKTPPPFSNLYVNDESIVYSTTASSSTEGRIKKHNTKGLDTLDNTQSDEQLTDIYVDQNGIIYTSGALGNISVYSRYGEFIFTFGAGESLDGDIVGVYSNLVSLAVSSTGEIFTIDNEKSYLLSYQKTEYAHLIYEGLRLFDEGDYVGSADKWEEVLVHNQMSKIAYDQLGKTFMFRQEYEEAMEYFKLSKNREFYSQAYWEVRNVQIQDGIPTLFTLLLAFIVIRIGLKITNKKTNAVINLWNKFKNLFKHKHFKEIFYAFKVMRHPSDGFYQIRKGRINGFIAPTFFMLLGFIAYVWNTTSKGFLFQLTDIEDINILALTLGYFTLFGGFVVVNYLVTSITDGIGGLKKIYISTAYAIVPYIFALVLSTIFTHVASLDETFFVTFTVFIGVLWSGLLLFLGSTLIQNYDGRVTFKSFIFTLLLMIIMIVVVLFLQLMLTNIIEFVINVITEVIRLVF